MLAWSEGTSTSRYTKADGYDVVVGGIDSPNTFSSYADHPAILVAVNRKGLKSTAAGRYQLLHRYWKIYKDQLGLKDFSPASQDAVAIQQIKERRALADIESGKIESAIEKCKNIWASLPGAGYGQKEHAAAPLVAKYKAAGGTVV
jgi:muramidase (phage lysozyme)